MRLVAAAALLVACIPFLSAPIVYAGSVSGAFVDSIGGAPLAAVEVVLRRHADSTVVAHATTSADGRFRLDSLAPGRYGLRAWLLGHRPYRRDDLELSAAAPHAELGTQVLAVAPLAIPGITATTERATAIVQSDRNVYLTKDMAAASSGTATDVLRAVPELEVDIDGNVRLRGSPGTTIQFNGRTSPLRGEALATYLRSFPAGRIERVEVIANPSAKFDPEGAAGIVNIVLKDDLDLGLSGSLYVGAGTRSENSGARVAWQRGPLTLFGGVSGYWSANTQRFDDARDNLAAVPRNHYRLSSRTEFPYGYGMSDFSADFALDKRSTVYATLNGWLNEFRSDGLAHVALLDPAMAPTLLYDRETRGDNDGRSGSATAGFRHVVQQGRHEWSVEYKHSGSRNGSATRTGQEMLVPADSAGVASRQDGTSGSGDRSLQADATLPLGAKGKLEAGYQASDRRSTNDVSLGWFGEDGGPAAFPPADASDYVHHEVFHSGYLTAGTTIGRASLQLGARAEGARTTFDVGPDGRHDRRDYRSLFPSANAAWDFGGGRTLRLSYSKRIERPSAWYLNPHVPVVDSLNRFVGNPGLGPKYTHSWSLEASWAGSRGLLRFSPYHRRTVDNWDRYTRVDSAGAATTTWLNASSIWHFGASVTASLRQSGRIGGTLGASLFREEHDAANLAAGARRAVTGWSASANVTFKAHAKLDLQANLNYRPAQTLAQGRISSNVFTYIGARWKLGEHASAGLWAGDPFNLWKYEYATGDATYAQRSTNRYSVRSATLSLSWAWGKPPEQKPRKQPGEQPQQPAPGMPGP